MVVIQLGDTEPTAVLGERKGRRNEGLTHGGGGRVEGSVQWREYSQGWGVREGGNRCAESKRRDREAQRCAQAKGEGDRERGRSQAAPSPEG